MKPPESSENEQDRLSALRSLTVLDTPPEERFDRVTRMARRLFGVPIALVSMVDENRQWFKSCLGLDVTETERRISFCGHAILQNGIMVVEDALQDERFHDNPLVSGAPHIRFYAGYPLRTLSGHGLGTLCIIDRVPRKFEDGEIEILADLAGMVERELIAIQLAVLDDLTRISNRRGFLALSRYSLDLCRRQLFPTTLAFFDLDQFKQINDTYGHAEGDQALRIFADQLRESFRASDIFARLGGDEFAALITNVTRETVQDMLARFKNSLTKRCAELKLPYALEFSLGKVEYDPLKHATIEDLLKDADVLMYEQKKTR